MTDIMALVSLSTSDAPAVGTKLRMDRHLSTESELAPLARGGRLYVVTLRSPPEELWLVAILDQPMFDGKQWVATVSEIPITDITELRSKLEFTADKGWPDWCDSCQQTHTSGSDTWRLTAGDAALLDSAAGIVAGSADAGDRALHAIGEGSGQRRGELLDTIIDDPANDEAGWRPRKQEQRYCGASCYHPKDTNGP